MKDLKSSVDKLFQGHLLNSFYLIIPPIIGAMTILITLPVVLHNLSVADYGKFQFILSLQAWMITLTGNNITAGSKRGIAKGLDGTFLFAFIFRFKILMIVTIMGIVASFFVYAFGFNIMSMLLLIVSLFLIFGYPFQISFTEFFIAKKQFKIFSVWQTLILVSGPLMSAIVAYMTKNVIYFALAQLGAVAFFSWIGWGYVVVRNNLTSAYKKGEIDDECRSYGLKLIPADIVNLTANRISHFIIGPFLGFANLAVFSVADRFRIMFINQFIKQIRGLFYADFVKTKEEKNIRFLKSKIKLGLFISIIINITCILGVYFYITLFLPSSYQYASSYFLIVSLALPAAILQIITKTILEVNFRYKELTVLAIFSNLAKIVSIIALAIPYRIIGVCIGIVLGGWIDFCFYYLLTTKRERVLEFIHKYPFLKELTKKY